MKLGFPKSKNEEGIGDFRVEIGDLNFLRRRNTELQSEREREREET